jgi:hypothetical protein
LAKGCQNYDPGDRAAFLELGHAHRDIAVGIGKEVACLRIGDGGVFHNHVWTDPKIPLTLREYLVNGSSFRVELLTRRIVKRHHAQTTFMIVTRNPPSLARDSSPFEKVEFACA